MLVGKGVSDRVWDILGLKDTLLVIDLEMVRVIDGVSVVVTEVDGGTPIVPAKL